MRMTCQCCGRKYLAKTGTIAHHGYTRPFQGWQTRSCDGAKRLPFEVSRDALGFLIDDLGAHRAKLMTARYAVANDSAGVVLSYRDRSKPRDRYGRHGTSHLTVTRETFEAVRAANADMFRMHMWYDFDIVLANDLMSRDREIKSYADEIEAQKARFDGWKQTHEWAGNGEWRAL